MLLKETIWRDRVYQAWLFKGKVEVWTETRQHGWMPLIGKLNQELADALELQSPVVL